MNKTGGPAGATSRPVHTGLPILALVLGAIAMGISPIFVREADVGPFTSAFWRVAAALPALWAWAAWEARREGKPLMAAFRIDRAIALAGLLFSADLFFWHLAIVHTTVANATFLATLAPLWVVLGSGLFIGEAVSRSTVFGLAICILGAAALVGSSASLAPDHIDGDLYGIATSVFFGAYFLAVRRARRDAGTGRIIFLSSLITAAVLLIVALVAEHQFFPHSLVGLAALLALALVSHSGGQGFLTYALGHLPAAFSALVNFLEAVAAALFGWLILDEPLTLLQAAGGVLIIAGVIVARPTRSPQIRGAIQGDSARSDALTGQKTARHNSAFERP